MYVIAQDPRRFLKYLLQNANDARRIIARTTDMASSVETVVEPFVRRGLFATPERAVQELARDFVAHQIEHHRGEIAALEAKYGMRFEPFDAYLRARASTLAASPNPTLQQAIMLEEEDALTWKTANELLKAWLGVQAEVGV